ncbi:alpha/beta hydrolase [Nocardioides carbamazepini]|uniref:alpha/beta fold hydrolase n=1 Tax=Nocardioides carbamazepini TaxID=2854259 RepID=UPI002149CFCD|nr:alpha/beta hydrolase [Nocardioides carbamazepini]MCR1783749.1 alpha/beta hydrolase [Nocardioides carbamazepini]
MRNLAGSSTRDYARLPWGQVHLRRAGEPDAPALVMVHQSPLSSATFEAAVEPLAALGLQVIAPDTPGFGMSDPTPEPWAIPEYAAGLWQLVDGLGLGDVVLLGQHTGAVVASEAAIQRPDRVKGLVLQGLPIYSEAERAEKKAGYAPPYEPALDGSHLLVIWDRVRRLYPELAVDELDRQVLEYLATGPDFGTAYRAVFEHRLDTEALRGTPIALVHGERDLVHRFTELVTSTLDWAELELVPGTDFAADEHTGAFVAAVGRWAQRFHQTVSAGAGR